MPAGTQPSLRHERYTEATLARAIREGIDADGRALTFLMPRFALGDADMTQQEVDRIVCAGIDEGINYIDTSIDYGLSEERIGRYIANRRSEYFFGGRACPGSPRSSPRRR